jgi:DNA-binding transcriptional MerR regulator
MAKESSPKKLFRIGEVSRITGVNPHVLRYWESEFQILAPNRRLSKQRLYRRTDIDLILTIKNLLEDEKYTLSGIKKYLAEQFASRKTAGASDLRDTHPSPAEADPATTLHMVRQELEAIRKMLDPS